MFQIETQKIDFAKSQTGNNDNKCVQVLCLSLTHRHTQLHNNADACKSFETHLEYWFSVQVIRFDYSKCDIMNFLGW